MESKKDGDESVKERRGSFSCTGGVLFSVRRRNPALTEGNIEVLTEDKGRVDLNSFEESLEFTR